MTCPRIATTESTSLRQLCAFRGTRSAAVEDVRGPWHGRRVATPKTLESELPWLLDELCTELGFCLRPEQRAALEASPPRNADAFAEAVFAAEGIDPSNSKRLYAQVRDKVQRRVGQWLNEPGN